MASPDQTKGKARAGAKQIRIYNCTVCTLVEGVAAGVNVHVRATSVRTARTRAAEKWMRRRSLTATSRQTPATAVTLAIAAARLQDATKCAVAAH